MNVRDRRLLIAKWKKCNWLTCSEQIVYQRFDAIRDGNEVKPFHKTGRPKLLPDTSVDDIADEINSKYKGKKFGLKEIEVEIKKTAVKEQAACGLMNL